MNQLRNFILLSTVWWSNLGAQNHFPEFIPAGRLVVELEEVVTMPDSSRGNPPRVSVLTEDPAGRLFANDQRGPLYLIRESVGRVTKYLDLRDYPELALTSTFEAGFQSFAFHPDFYLRGADGFGTLYTIHSSLNVSATPDFDPGGGTDFHTLVLAWKTAEPERPVFLPAEAGSPYRELMRFKQPFGNHNAGLIAFNPTVTRGEVDYGNLYIALGDGGAGGDPQENGEDPSNPFGALLRIDPTGNDSRNRKYGLVAENVFAADNNAGTIPEIYCYGLRNPQRFGWDLVTGNCFIADIGQNAIEEIDLAANGAHFGWDLREGSFRFEGNDSGRLVGPVAEYDHTSPVSRMPTSIGSRAVTLGEVARGTCVTGLDGQLLISDFPTGLIFLLDVDNDPLDGGQDGLTELRVSDSSGTPSRFLDLVNAARADRGLGATNRADLRFSVNTPGQVYLTNKHDGIIRRIKPTTLPTIELEELGEGRGMLHFNGLLQQSSDLETWSDVIPQPRSPWEFSPTGPSRFFRSISK